MVAPQWHFEKGYWLKTWCLTSLIYAVDKYGIGKRGETIGIGA